MIGGADHSVAPRERSREVSLDASASLVERVQMIARVRGEERATLLVDAVRSYLDDVASSEDVRRLVAEQYYDDRLALEQVKQIVGSVEAQRLRLLMDDLRDDPLEL